MSRSFKHGDQRNDQSVHGILHKQRQSAFTDELKSRLIFASRARDEHSNFGGVYAKHKDGQKTREYANGLRSRTG